MNLDIDVEVIYTLQMTQREFRIIAAAIARTSPSHVLDVLANAGDDAEIEMDEAKEVLSAIFGEAEETFGWYQ